MDKYLNHIESSSSNSSRESDLVFLYLAYSSYYFPQVSGKSRCLRYVARIDTYDHEDDDYEGVFLEKLPARLGDYNEVIFIVNEKDRYSFAASDILVKLPYPKSVGGSLRKRCNLKFDFDFKKWDLAY